MKLFVVGLGPGGIDQISKKAMKVLQESEIIIGYIVYVYLIRYALNGKIFYSTPMTQEIERCRAAIELASKGKKVSVVCSGDAGVYGMAGLIYELVQDYDNVEVEVVSGITAACSGAAVLGAPLTHDFAVISLSDLLTPWDLIETRLDCASKADFVICLYNASSRKRHDYLQKACDIVLKHRSPKTVCGYVQNIDRESESAVILTLQQLRDTNVNMYTTVYIGNSQTKEIQGKMVTPRGYSI